MVLAGTVTRDRFWVGSVLLLLVVCTIGAYQIWDKTMRRISCIVLSAILFGLVACNGDSVISGNAVVIPIDYDNYEKVSMDKVFSRIEVVSLEGNEDSYLMGYDKIVMKDGRYYIKDQNCVFVFDSLGNYKYNTKSRQGRGHNEYLSVNDFYVSDDSIVYIMDYDGRVRGLDPKLKMVKTFKVKLKKVYYYEEIQMISDDLLLLSTDNSRSDTIIWNYYSISKNDIVGTSRVTKMRKDGIVYEMSSYYRNDSQLLYRPRDDGYRILGLDSETQEVYEAYIFDVGKDCFDPSELDEDEVIARYLKNNPDKYVYLMFMSFNNNYLISTLGHLPVHGFLGTDMRLSFYSLKDGHQRLFDYFFEGNKYIRTMDIVDDRCIQTFVNDYDDLNNLYDEKLLDEKSKQVLKGVNDETNALIIKYYFRTDI